MAASRSRAGSNQPEIDIRSIIAEAQNRWLRPVEVCEILKNYATYGFRVNPVPPVRPCSGSMFLFDRKTLRYFRKDGHNWRKKKDGKTVREAHERLKTGSVDVLHCYYAHGEDNPSFQRRCYWMLDPALEHIVLVHYREVTEGGRFSMSDSQHSAPAAHAASPPEVSNPSTSPDIDPDDGDQVESEDTEEQSSLEPIVPPNTGLQDTLLDQLTPRSARAAADLNSSPVNGWIGGDLRGGGNVASSAWLSSSSGAASSSLESLLNTPTGLTPRPGQPFPPQQQPQQQAPHKQTSNVMNNQFPDVFGGQDAFSNSQSRQENFSGSNDVAGWRHLMESSARSSSNLESSFAPQLSNTSLGPPSVSQSGGGGGGAAGGAYVKQESMNGATIWAEMLEQCTTPSTHRNIMESLMNTGSNKNNSNINNHNNPANSPTDMTDSPRIQDQGSPQIAPSKGILEALSPRGLGREPQTALEASLQAVTQEKALKTAGLYQRRLQQGVMLRSESQPLDLQFEKKPGQEKSPEIEAFPKLDSFGRWMTCTIDGQSVLSPGAFQSSWPGTPTMGYPGLPDDMYHNMQVDSSLSTSVSSDQRYSITDLCPDWAYASEGTKVLVCGGFLGDYANAGDVKWHCMFGEVEVPAEVLSGGVLRCKAPPHGAGIVSFYVTCGDRQAHSEIRDFEYCSGGRVAQPDPKAEAQATEERGLKVRLARMLMTESEAESPVDFSVEEMATKQTSCLNSFSSSYSKDDWVELETEAKSAEYAPENSFQERLVQTMLKTGMQRWLLCKIQEEGKGASVLDAQGQGVFHMAAALGYEWVVAPMVAAGVPINFRDVHGWTALHWAAWFGKEQAVIALIQHGADPGTVTDPTPSCPSGQTPADLALAKGHVGIGGFLAESSLTHRIATMSISESSFAVASAQLAGDSAVEKLARRNSIKQTLNRGDDQVSIRDSLQAVRNAARAAALIQATFRHHSVRKEEDVVVVEKIDEYGMTESQMRGFVAAKAAQRIQKAYRGVHEKKQQLAASRIQQKFRSWKVRKDFVNLRQRVVRIQAQVRGNLVRRRFRKLLWSVGVLEKVILRWKRKRLGLRGFKSGEVGVKDTKEDDEEFLKENRKQAEKAVEKAVTTVTTMVRSQPGREQYRRLREGSMKADQLGQFLPLSGSPQDMTSSPDVEYPALEGYEDLQNEHMNQYLDPSGDDLMNFRV